jgi:hypothetical protein
MKSKTSFLGSILGSILESLESMAFASVLSPMAALVTVLVSFSASTASANIAVFDQLRGLFSTGVLPVEADLAGWRTGRCYHADQPFRPHNGLMVGWFTQGPDHGPIGRGAQTLRTLPVYWANGAPGIFDEPSPQVIHSVERFLDHEAPLVARAQYDERTVYGTYVDRFEQQWALRKATSTFLHSPLTQPSNEPIPGPNPEPQPEPQPEPTPGPTQDYIVARMTRNGYVVQYCYYFKVIR